MSASSNLVVPIILWGRNAPTHCISAVLMTPDQKNIITGCNDGQIVIWDISDTWEIYPRSMLFGHTSAISCLALGSGKTDTPYIVSASENGEMCLWDISDGRCVENSKMSHIHTNMQAYSFYGAKDIRLVCNGYYPEILIINPYTFEILYTLSSKVAPDWISACCILKPIKRDDDVVVAISNSGAVKVWTLTGSENRTQPVYENESKQIRCLNAQTLACCPYNQRTVLIVCSKYWQVYDYAIHASPAGAYVGGIYDAGDFTLLCSESNRCGERWSGGDFISVDKVIVWSNEGKGYLYKLPTNANPENTEYRRPSHQPSSPHAYYILDTYSESSMACSPAMTFHIGKGEKSSRLLVRGDSEGQVVVWTLPEVTERQMTLVRQESFDRLPALPPRCRTTLQEVWDSLYQTPVGIIDGFYDDKGKPLHITSTIYIPSQGKIACGQEDGSIVIAPATHSVIQQLLEAKTINKDDNTLRILHGHDGRVTCLLYPFNESARYEPHYLLSGGADFSVILWDIYTGSKLHTFTVHGGEITQLLVPPNNCNNRILSSICSVASDHSVTLLSLKERKCIMLAARHLFPVQVIRWRPLDDFMVVSCSDGTAYVWQMETGHLDRVVHGITAEEILNNCDENAIPLETLINPNITLTQALKRRNLATFKNLAQQKLQQQAGSSQQAGLGRNDMLKPQAYPMFIQGVRTNTRDPDSHILFFDTEALIVQLLTEEFALMSPGELEAKGLLPMSDNPELGDMQFKVSGVMAKLKEKTDIVSQKIQSRVESSGFSPIPTFTGPGSGRNSPVHISKSKPDNLSIGSRKSSLRSENMCIDSNLTLEIAQLFMSCLHAWGLDPDLDRLCVNKLGLFKPKCPISFGLISRCGHMSLMLPGWHKGVFKEEALGDVKSKAPAGKVTLMQQARSASYNQLENIRDSPKTTLKGSVDAGHSDYTDSEAEMEQATPTKIKPVAKVKGIEVLQKEMKIFSTKARWRISSAVTTQHLLSVISTANTLMSMSHASFATGRAIKHKKRKKYASHLGLLVAETATDSSDNTSEDETDAQIMHQSQIKQGWSLLAALHCVLLPEMVGPIHLKAPQLEMLARRWQDRCLEIREAAQALLLAELRRIGPEGRKAILDQWSPFLPSYVDPSLSLLNAEPQKGDDEEDEDEDDPMLTDSPLHKTSSTFESRRKQATAIVMLGVIGAEFGHEIEPSRRKIEEQRKGKKSAQDGFTLQNYSLSRHTSKALTFLLQQPPSRRLPAHTPIRRAAIDLIGRGFTVWEPYLDVSAVLLGLLELCIDSDRLVPSMTFGLPLSPVADACRTARHALSLIATARPPAFIITMAKEVARHNAMAQTAQAQHSQITNSVLVRGKQEILRVVELLVEKMPNDVADHLVEAMDITVHCLDSSQLKSKGLLELFPAICRFSMVSVCPVSKRIWVGAKNGGLAFYDLKQHSKCQMITAHSGPVIAVSVSSDGKFLVTFSHGDSRLKFWQTASSSLFGIGSQQHKCVKQTATPPVQVTNLTNVLKLVRLVWVDTRTIVMLTVDGREQKYSV